MTTDSVWIRGQNDVLIRADAIILLARVHDGLIAECLGGYTVQLTGSKCSNALQLALLEEIRRAGAGDRRAVVIMPPTDGDATTWRRECVDTPLDHR